MWISQVLNVYNFRTSSLVFLTYTKKHAIIRLEKTKKGATFLDYLEMIVFFYMNFTISTKVDKMYALIKCEHTKAGWKYESKDIIKRN